MSGRYEIGPNYGVILPQMRQLDSSFRHSKDKRKHENIDQPSYFCLAVLTHVASGACEIEILRIVLISKVYYNCLF